MCDHQSTSYCGEKQKLSAKPSRQRLKIWALPASYHCPVIGVCIPLAILRRLVNKAVQGETQADDYEIHVGAVNECSTRNKLSKAIQEDLDRRHVQAIYRLRTAATPVEVYAFWRAAEEDGDLAGAFWASVTHPDCDVPTREAICREMHMVQHQAGARARIEQSRFDALANEHRVLTAELGRVQARCTDMIAQKNAEIERLNRELQQARGSAVKRDTEISGLQTELASLRQITPDLHARAKLKRRVTELIGFLRERNRQIVQAQQTIEHLKRQARPAADAAPKPESQVEQGAPAVDETALATKTILCVGGRNNAVLRYRDSVESHGGRFCHHDGGLEDNIHQLDATLEAADLVICQTGCISHNAYWRVKEHCKRTGKRCVFVDKPGQTSISRILFQISSAVPAAEEEKQGT